MSIRPHYEQETWAGTRRQLRRWQRGETGFPLVDAAMRQLWKAADFAVQFIDFRGYIADVLKPNCIRCACMQGLASFVRLAGCATTSGT